MVEEHPVDGWLPQHAVLWAGSPWALTVLLSPCSSPPHSARDSNGSFLTWVLNCDSLLSTGVLKLYEKYLTSKSYLEHPRDIWQRFLRRWKQIPISYSLEISKFPLFMLLVFGKIWEMSTDRYIEVSWRMFWKDCKTESQGKTSCKQALIFRLPARLDQTKQAGNKQGQQVKDPSQ